MQTEPAPANGAKTSVSEAADAAAIHAYLRSRARHGPRIGPFSVLFSQGDRGLYGNYAVPDDGAEPTAAEITGLEDLFRERRRVPRLEYLPAATPALESLLVRAGFTPELRPPLMVRRPGMTSASALQGFDLRFVDDEARLREAVRVETLAWGGPESDSLWLMRTVERGGRVLVAYEAATGEAVGAGALTPEIGGVREVVAIAVVPAFRRRGVAQALTAELAEAALRDGCDLVFLSAAGESQSAIYARAGFERRAPMLFISKPSGP